MSIRKLVLTGDDIGETDLAAVIAFAKARGFAASAITVPDQPDALPEPSWTDDELRHVDPLGELTHMYISADNRKWLTSIHVLTAYDLTQLTFEMFLEPHRGVSQRAMRMKSQILEFMIRHRIRFTDLDPAAVFPISIAQSELSVRTHNALRREGIERLGVLVYFTARDLQDDIRNFGPKSIDEVRLELARHGLALKGE